MAVYEGFKKGLDLRWDNQRKDEYLAQPITFSIDGKNYTISRSGYKNYQNQTLGSYTPKNDEERKTIEDLNNSPVKIKDSSGKEYTVTYKDYTAFNNAQKGNLGSDWLPITYPASNKEKEGQIAGYYNKNTGKQYTLDDINSIVSSGVISPEGVKVLTDYGNSENKYQKEKAAIEYANGVPEKYGYKAFDFDEKDLEEWAKKNNYVYAEEYSYNGGKMGKKLMPIGEVTEQQKKDGQVLMAVVENNRALKSSKTDWGALAAGTHGFLDAATFGILPALTEWGSKSQYESAGLNPEYRVTYTESMGKTMAEHQTAGIVGSIAGGLATSIGVSSGISAGLAKAGWAVGTAPIARGAVVQGLTGVIRGGTTTAAQGGDWGDIGINALREGLTGVAGGAVGGIAEKGLTKLLTNSKYAASTLGKLKDLKFTAYGVNALGGVADALADYGTDKAFVSLANNVFDAKLQERTGKDLLTDFAVSLALGTAMNIKQNTKAGVQTRIDDVVNRYGAEFTKYSQQISGADVDVETRIKAGEEFIETTNKFKKEFNEQLFPGKAKEVETLHQMLDVAIDSTKMDIERAKNGEVKTESAKPVSTETSVTPKPTTTKPTVTKIVSTEGGVVKEDISGAIERIQSGTATNKDFEMFKTTKLENRKMLEDALGVKLPESGYTRIDDNILFGGDDVNAKELSENISKASTPYNAVKPDKYVAPEFDYEYKEAFGEVSPEVKKVATEYLADKNNYILSKLPTGGGVEKWLLKPNRRFKAHEKPLLAEYFETIGGKFSNRLKAWEFSFNPTDKSVDDGYYLYLRDASAKSKKEMEALATLTYNKYGNKTPQVPLKTVATEIAEPIYGGLGDVDSIASQIVATEGGTYGLKNELKYQEKTLTKSLKPTDVQLKHIEAIAKGQEDISEVHPTLNMKKFSELIDVKSQLHDMDNNLRKKIRNKTMSEFYEEIDDVIQNADKWKDKLTGIQWEINTARRNAYDTMGADAEKFIDTFIKPMEINDRLKIDYINGIKQEILDMELTDDEFALVQKYGEGLTDDVPDRIKQADAKFQQIARKMKDDVNAILVLNGYKPIDNPKITLYDKDLREALDVLDGKKQIYDVKNEKVRQFVTLTKRNGMDGVVLDGKGKMKAEISIPYYPHGSAAQGFKNALDVIGMGEFTTKLPGDIAGRTEDFSPNKKWVGNLQKRTGPKTDYDIRLWDGYINNVAEVIFHTSDISKLRMLETALRREFSNEGIQAKIKEAEETMSPEELNVFLNGLDRDSIKKHNNLINWIHEYANIIAGKQSHWDRAWERGIGRTVLNSFDKVTNMWAKNQVAGNLSSVFNQYLQTTNLLADNNTVDVMTAIAKVMTKHSDLAESDFITTRKGALRLKKSGVEKATDMLFWAAQKSDEFMSAVAYQTKYNEVIRKGGTVEEAKTAGDNYARDIMADRSKIGRPTIFAARNPVMRMLTTFQIDNINSVMHFFKDISRNAKAKGSGKLAVARTMFVTVLLSSLFNREKEEITGTQGVTFDIIALGEDVFKYLTGEMEGAELKESAIEQAARLPFAQTALVATGMEDVDRLPLAGTFKKIFKEGQPQEIISLVNPIGGYNQAKKMIQGIKTVAEGEVTDKNGNLMYPVEQSVGNYIKGGMFGKYSLPESQEYWDNNRKALTENETKEYNYRVGQGEDPQAVYNDIYSAKEERARQKAESDAYYNKVDSLVKPISDDLSHNVDELYNSYSTEYAATHGGDKPTGIKVPKASKEFKRNKKTYFLTEEQCAELQNMYNTAYVDKVTPILNNNNLSNKQKYNRISDVRKGIRESVERKFFAKYSGKLTKK